MALVAKKPCSFGGKDFFIGDEIPNELVNDPAYQEKLGVLIHVDDAFWMQGMHQDGIFSVPIIKDVDADTAEVLDITASGWYRIVWPGESCGYAFTKSGSAYYTYTGKTAATKICAGDIVQFTGNTHYVSSTIANGKTCKPGKAKVTIIAKNAKHPYHIVAVSGSGSDVHGWVDAATISK